MAAGRWQVGVAVDTLRDMEIIYEAFSERTTSTGPLRTSRSTLLPTLSWPCTWPWRTSAGFPEKLRATPQNDILKEFVARGTYIFSPRHSMRMFRDSLVFFCKNLPT